MTRTRQCDIGDCGECSGMSSENTTCSEGSVKTWGGWTPSSPCEGPCGAGSMAMTRVCTGCVGSCEGSSSATEQCEISMRYLGIRSK